ncbi:hypothetical protein [Egbenema bharatensis]|uniref:hypothetical protein n=1 Tax=Egbenema bharatensis TaxID=3463334 RepID=UPI003A870822
MKRMMRQPNFFRAAPIALGILGCGVLSAIQPAIAQTPPNPGLGSSDRGVNQPDDMPNMFDLMHELQRGSIRSPYEFQQDQQRNISNEAADFREQQRRALEQPIQPGTVEPMPFEASELEE